MVVIQNIWQVFFSSVSNQYYVWFCRTKSQLADVNIQPSVGMFAVYCLLHHFVKQLLNFIPHYNKKTFDSYQLNILVTFVGRVVNGYKMSLRLYLETCERVTSCTISFCFLSLSNLVSEIRWWWWWWQFN